MDERGNPVQTPQEGQQIPPTQFVQPQQPVQPVQQPQQPAAPQQPQYTYTPYAQQPYGQPVQPGQPNPYAQYGQPGQPNPYAQYGQPGQPNPYAQYGQPGQPNPYGQPPYGQPPKPPKAPKAPRKPGAHGAALKLPKWAIPGAIGAVALIVIIILAVTLIGGGGEEKVADATVEAITRLADNEVVSIAEETINGGSITIAIDADDVLEEMGAPSGMGASAQVKFYLDAGEGKTAIEVTAEIMDTAIDGAVYLNADEVVVQSEVLLDGAYGISIKDIEKNLEDSVFGPDGEYYVGDEAYELLMGIISGDIIDTAVVEGYYEDGVKLAEDYADFIVKTIFKHAEVEKERDTVSIDGEKVKVQIITVTVDGSAMFEIVLDVLEKIDGDKKLKTYLYDVAEYINKGQEEADMDEVDAEEMIDMFYEGVEEALDTAEDAREDFEDMSETIKAAFWLKGSDLVGLTVKAGETKLEVKIGPDPAKPELVSLKMDDGYTVMSAVYEVEEDSKDLFEANLTVKEDDYELMTAAVSYDKEEGEYDISLYDGWYTYGLTGAMEVKGDQYIITFDSIYGDVDVPEEVNMLLKAITVTVDTDDSVPGTPKYNEVLKMDEEDIQDLIQFVTETAQELVDGLAA